jgi:acyl carrier protein
MLTKTQVQAAVEKVLHDVQAKSGRPCPKITSATKPIGDLEDFDSLMAVEATVLLEKELNSTLDSGTPFVSTAGRKRALSVAEVVDRIVEMIVPTRAA